MTGDAEQATSVARTVTPEALVGATEGPATKFLGELPGTRRFSYLVQ